jgi:hypothetical protein
MRILPLLVLAAAILAADPLRFEDVVPGGPPSRPAHFNWRFISANGQPPQTGYFACGSRWVAPAVGDSAVVLEDLTGHPGWNDLLSCDVDPLTERHGLLSGKNGYGSYDASENILTRLPVTVTPPNGSCISLVAAMQRNEDETSKGGTRQIVGEVVDAYDVVTIMPTTPKNGGADMIRPNITGAHKEFLTWDDIDLTRLPTHAFLAGRSDEEWQSVQRRWRHATEVFGLPAEKDTATRGRTFMKFSEGGRAFRSALLIPDYAAGMARSFNGDVLALLADAPRSEAWKGALAAMLAFGLDIWHARYDYGDSARKGWSSGAGQSLGAFLPPVLAAALLRDESKAHRLRRAAVDNHGTDHGELGPQELRQIHRGRTGVLLWGDGWPIVRNDSTKLVEHDWRYWGELTGAHCYDAYAGTEKPNAAQGQKTAADPYGYIDGPAPAPGSNYMGVTVGGFRSFAAAMILIPAVRSVVNSDDPIEYSDRLFRHGLWTWPDPVAPPAKIDQDTAKLWWKAEGVQEWGKTWGPHLDDVRNAYEDGTGRFRKAHGKLIGKGGYESSQALEQWEKIIALYDGETFEARAVPLGTVVAPDIRFATGANPEVHLWCATPGATIHYTLDGGQPTVDSPIWDGVPLSPVAGKPVKALAIATGLQPSTVRIRSLPPPLR